MSSKRDLELSKQANSEITKYLQKLNKRFKNEYAKINLQNQKIGASFE